MNRARAPALGALAAPAFAQAARAQTVTLRTGTSPTDAYASPLYFAPSGLAAKAGVALDVNLFSSSTATAAGCASGALDIGVADRYRQRRGARHRISRARAVFGVHRHYDVLRLRRARGSAATAPTSPRSSSSRCRTRQWPPRSSAALARTLTATIYNVARWSNAHQVQTAVTLANATKVDIEKARSMHRATFVTGPEAQPVALSLAAAVRYGVLSRPVDLTELGFSARSQAPPVRGPGPKRRG